VRQRSSRVEILFLLAVTSIHRVRNRISRVAVASHRLLGAAAAKHFSLFVLFSVFLPTTEVRSGPMAVPDRPSCFSGEDCTTTHHHAARSQKFRFSPAAKSAESPLGGDF
jgi:hypothetical protein